MKNASPTHLYRFKDSQNHFIRFRMNFFKNIGYINDDDYFVASLRTSYHDDARWLAFYIKRNLMKEISMEGFSNNAVKYAVPLGDSHNPHDATLQSKINSNAQFKILLRQRFSELLKVGKLMLENGFGQNDELQKPLSEEYIEALHACSDKVASATEQAMILKTVSDGKVDLSIDPGGKYLDYRHMINALTTQLDELKTQLADYRLEAVGTPQACSSDELQNFTVAMTEHNRVKVRFDEQQGKSKDHAVNFYSIDNQLSLFLQEKTRTIDEDTI